MPTWKKKIFVNAIKIQLRTGEKNLEEILEGYPKLTDAEKDILRKEFSEELTKKGRKSAE